MKLMETHSSTRVFEETCLFCDSLGFQINYKKRTLICCFTVEIEESVTQFARMLNDEDIIVKIRDICFIAKEVQYRAYSRYWLEVKDSVLFRKRETTFGSVR